jgi:polyisoprenoid-binding protein YceI
VGACTGQGHFPAGRRYGTVSVAGDVTGTIIVAAGSVETNNKKRDDHLCSADFFDVAEHPDIIVDVRSIRPGSDGVTATGRLSVCGQTRPVALDAKVSGVDGQMWLDGEVEVNRADFGLSWNARGIASMHSTIAVYAVFTPCADVADF